MSLYMPTTDNCSSTDDVTTYQRYKKKIDIIMQYNKLDKVPTLLAGLLVPIQIYRDDIGATKIKNYCCSYNYQIDTTFADADISHYAQIDDIQYYSPRANLSNALMPTIVSNNSISPARSIAERRRQRASQSLQPTNIPPILASPPASPAPQLIVSAVSAKQAVSILQSLYSWQLTFYRLHQPKTPIVWRYYIIGLMRNFAKYALLPLLLCKAAISENMIDRYVISNSTLITWNLPILWKS